LRLNHRIVVSTFNSKPVIRFYTLTSSHQPLALFTVCINTTSDFSSLKYIPILPNLHWMSITMSNNMCVWYNNSRFRGRELNEEMARKNTEL
ncbi:MAG: hypothetical protein ABS938_17155, partial [Psychrobacillus psychrodurans]